MRRRLVLIFLTVVGQFFAVGAGLAFSGPPDNLPSKNTDDQISQLFILQAYPGGNEQHFSVLQNQIKKNHPGGLIIRNGTPGQIASLVDRMNSASDQPLWVGGDLNMSGFILPPEPVITQIKDVDLLRETGVLLGERLAKAGIDFIIDPSLDAKSEKYSYGRYFAQGFFTEGIMPVYKLGELLQTTGPGAVILPYEAPIQVSKRKLDYSQTSAAKLRASGFENIIIIRLDDKDIADDMAALHALKSGADMLIYPDDPSKVIARIKKYVRGGDIAKEEIEEKYLRVTKNKFRSRQPYTEQVRYISTEKDEYISQKLYTASAALVKKSGDLLPFGMLDTLDIAIYSKGPFEIFNKYIRKYDFVYDASETDPVLLQAFDAIVLPINNETDLEWVNALPDKSRFIVVAFGLTDLSRLTGFDYVLTAPVLNDYTQKFMPQVIYGAEAATGQWTGPLPKGFSSSIQFETLQRLSYDHPLSAYMDKNTLMGIDKIAMEAITKGATPGLQVLVARNGKVVYEKSYGYQTYEQESPVTDETIYDLASVTKVLATLQGVMFMQEKRLIDLEKPLSDYLPELKGSNKEELILKDILLHQAGLRPWLPFWRQTMDDNSLSGDFYSRYPEEQFPLQVSEGLYATQAIRDSVWSWIIDSRLMNKKTDEPYGYRYSDMGFYMMQRLVEARVNQPLNEFVSQNLYDPLGMYTTTYLPLCKFNISEIAPTAEDMYFRKGLVDGLVHDEGAAMFGGVAGHSGLFSNANDLAKLLQMLLQGGNYGGSQYFRPETIELFSQKQVKDNRRGLGWDKPNVGHWRSPTSEYATGETFGHTGFTGTAVWVDPAYDLVYVFLSNRINPDAENAKLMELNIRSRIQDLIYKSIWQLDQYKEIVTPEP